jgi:hypothetical protein
VREIQRISANASVRADGASTHCTSSMAIVSGAVSASVLSAASAASATAR